MEFRANAEISFGIFSSQAVTETGPFGSRCLSILPCSSFSVDVLPVRVAASP